MLRKLLASFNQHVEDIRLFIVEQKWKLDFEDENVATVIRNCLKQSMPYRFQICTETCKPNMRIGTQHVSVSTGTYQLEWNQ